MFRKTAWRNAASDAVSFHQGQALNTTIFLLKCFGPTGFLLREDREAKDFKVCLGDPHTCSCPVFTREQEPCKHICWVLLRKFRLPREHEYSFQHGLVERQILEVLQGLHQTEAHRTENDPSTPFRTASQTVAGQKAGSVCRKVIQAQDVCPICQEELLEKNLPVSYCRFGCGNNVHISCMKVWADHQRLSDREETVKCPLCREDFSSLKSLQEQVKNAAKLFTAAEREKPERHLGVICQSCRVCPVTGKCFKCTVCSYLYLCEDCSNKGCHPQHAFASRTTRRDKWQLVADDLSDEPTGATCGSTVPVAADLLPDSVSECLPVIRVRPGSRLLDEGQQCRICLQDFSLGQRVRTLPCQHKFHADCVDRTLQKSNSCPLDGYVIYNHVTRRSSERKTAPQSASRLLSDFARPTEDHLKDLFIPGVALRDRNTKVTPPRGSLNLEVLTAPLNPPHQFITDRFQGLHIATTDTVMEEGKQTLTDPRARSSKKRATAHSHASPAGTKLSHASPAGTKLSHASPAETKLSHASPAGTKLSHASPAGTKLSDQPQLNLFVGLWRPQSDHTATAASAARPTRRQPKKTGVVTSKGPNKQLSSELRMTGVLINTQHQTQTKT
ncbi:E3 ubiquitin-protein ligase Zswim2 [Larimichthys crocea]|uniref:Uncharacterized protein n=1 Tax=Larimichthys crocea TaxID=215358 RepID=A0ACD3QWZ1_LARCR|nr:E3 ubiquitin-protein ligase Zswim2 [Larimichthys crocea]